MAVGYEGAGLSENAALEGAAEIVERMGCRPRLSDDVRDFLNGEPDMDKMLTRPGAGGRDLAYIPWNVNVEVANAKLGADGWSHEVTAQSQTPFYGVDPSTGERGVVVGYACSATVRVTIYDERGNRVVRENVGTDEALFSVGGKDGKRMLGIQQQMDALQNAQKGAVSVGIRRAFVTFGDKFGLMLYDKPTGEAYAKEIKKRKKGGQPRPVNRSSASANGAAASPSAPAVSPAAASPAAPAASGAVCPVHGDARVNVNKYGPYCATRVGEDEDGRVVFCKEKPVVPAGAVSAPPRPAPTPAPAPSRTPPAPPPSTPIGAPGGYVNGYANGYANGAATDDVPYGCPVHKAGSHIRPSKFGGGSGYWCSWRDDGGAQCKRTDMVPMLVDDGSDPAAGQAMTSWDAIAATGDPEREQALAEFYSLIATFGPGWESPDEVDASLGMQGRPPVSVMTVGDIRENSEKMRQKLVAAGMAR